MIEVQCSSCNTRYRIDERVLPDETPTFKCSRCGHVFNAEPLPVRPRKPADPRVVEKPSAPSATGAGRPAPPPRQAKPGAGETPGRKTEEPPSVATGAEAPQEDPLDRTFAREHSGELDSGENLTFDFARELDLGGERAESEDPGVEHHSSEDH